MDVFKKLCSVAASIFVNYFAIFKGVDYVTKQWNYFESIFFLKAMM